MFFAAGNQEVRSTIGLLVGAEDDLRGRLGGWLAKKQGADIVGDCTRSLELVDDVEVEARLLRTFKCAPTPGDIAKPITDELLAALPSQRNAERVRAKLARMAEAAQLLERTCDGLHDVFSTVINRIFVVELDKEGGGSSMRSVGAIWANPTSSASVWDLAEFLVHELTHQTLILDEQVHGHFTDRTAAHSGSGGFLPKSSIRNARRPLGPVFHSLAVALEVASFRALVGEQYEPKLHPGTDRLLASAQDTIRSIVWELDWQKQFRPRGRYLFEAYRDLWERLACQQPGVIPRLIQE
ncbi:MAG TPA: HEXXH motif-containing putative peptide modification protein [Kofleriaceae bacterium]|nr:HEXXH motif-containing putative peptide modification protein [Kofleriaceae bacterium]